MREPILTVSHVSKAFPAPGEGGFFHAAKTPAVEDVSFTVGEGETFGLVGESGCGKSTIAKLIMGLETPDQGEIFFRGQRISGLHESKLRPLRPQFQMVFQDSGSSLNPRKRVAELLSQPMVYHGVIPRSKADARVAELLDMVGLPQDAARRYPHEFSGGQRQRICIARALSMNPALIVLDEPVSALDVSVQAQILNLLKDLQQELKLTYVFIGHGLGAVRYVSHRLAVMYMGRIVESGDAEEVFAHPVHPYTRALLDAAPVADYALRNRPRAALKGEVGAKRPAAGCPLRERCPMADAACAALHPELAAVPGREGHEAACIRGAR